MSGDLYQFLQFCIIFLQIIIVFEYIRKKMLSDKHVF